LPRLPLVFPLALIPFVAQPFPLAAAQAAALAAEPDWAASAGDYPGLGTPRYQAELACFLAALGKAFASYWLTWPGSTQMLQDAAREWTGGRR